MGYADQLQAIDAYRSKHSGAAIAIVVYDNDDPASPVVGACTGINGNDDYEIVQIEEAGQEGVNEQVPGRSQSGGSISLFWTPERNDKLPSRLRFINKEYTILEVIARVTAKDGEFRPGQDTVVQAWKGVRFTQHSNSHGARGVKTTNLSFVCLQRLTGLEWARETGTA